MESTFSKLHLFVFFINILLNTTLFHLSGLINCGLSGPFYFVPCLEILLSDPEGSASSQFCRYHKIAFFCTHPVSNS